MTQICVDAHFKTFIKSIFSHCASHCYIYLKIIYIISLLLSYVKTIKLSHSDDVDPEPLLYFWYK